MNYLQGKLLIASTTLEDPNFDRSVVLLVRHNHEGALGVILNRPLETSLQEAIAPNLPDVDVEADLYQGGPCQGPLMVLHTQEDAAEMEVRDGLYFSIARDKVEWLLRHQSDPVRYFVGYAGWEADQLEAELATGSWLLADSAPDLLFEDRDDLWEKLVATASLGRWIRSDQIPDDPSSN